MPSARTLTRIAVGAICVQTQPRRPGAPLSLLRSVRNILKWASGRLVGPSQGLAACHPSTFLETRLALAGMFGAVWWRCGGGCGCGCFGGGCGCGCCGGGCVVLHSASAYSLSSRPNPAHLVRPTHRTHRTHPPYAHMQEQNLQ